LEPPAPRSASVIDLGVRLVTVAEAATLLRVSKMTVYRLIHTHAVPATRIGRSLRIQRRDLTEFLDPDRHHPTPSSGTPGSG
jgi:excisionase family DNA binding protein